MTVKPPRLLDANRSPVAILHPSRLSLDLPLRDVCTAQIELTDKDPGLAMHDLLHLYTAAGDAGLYRVTDITRESSGQVRATLRHALDTLSDDVWPVAADTQGNVTPVDYSGTMTAYLTAVLAKQTTVRWRLGTCADTSDWVREGIFFSRLSDLINEVAQDREDYYFDFDFSTWPWTLNFLALPATVTGDLRLSRNVESATVTRSDADMCNKLYMSISTTTESGGQSSTSVVYRTYDNTASQSLYGAIAKTADVDTAYVPDPDAWAQRFLDQRAAPAVQITVDGYELKALTGMDWDAFSRGQRVRAILGDLERITTRVEQITYPDVLGQPERVEVQLANRLPSFTETISQMRAVTRAVGGGAGGGGGYGRASADQLKHWAMILTDTAEAADGTGILEMWQSGIEIDARAGVKIHSLFQGFESTYTEIDTNKDGIQLLTDKTGIEGLAEGETLRSLITLNANRIALRVEKGDVATQLAVEAGNVSISGGNLIVDGYVTAAQFSALQANFNSVASVSGSVTTLSSTTVRASTSLVFQGYYCIWVPMTYVDSGGTSHNIYVMSRIAT